MYIVSNKTEERQRWSRAVKTVNCAAMRRENLVRYFPESGDGTQNGAPGGRHIRRGWLRNRKGKYQIPSQQFSLCDPESLQMWPSPTNSVADIPLFLAKRIIWKLDAGFPGDTFVLGVHKDGKWVLVAVTTVSMLVPYDEAQFSEIAHTLQFE